MERSPTRELVVLASGSPRRRKLLAEAGIPFQVVRPRCPETWGPNEPPEDLVVRLAREKAAEVAARLDPDVRRVVLASDTVVVLDGQVLGKPGDAQHALQLLRRLCGRTHRVLTGIAVLEHPAGSRHQRWVESRVTLRSAGEEELGAYVASGEPLDKAGAYALQGAGRRFVQQVEGSESNVIGLPLRETLQLLRQAGVEADPR